MLHVLLHMAERSGPATSAMLAKAIDTHPVVIRRIMAGLDDHDPLVARGGSQLPFAFGGTDV